MQRSAERQSMRDGSAAAQDNALVPYNEAGPWRRFSEAAGPGQTTNQGFRGGMLPGPAPDFIEGEILPPPAGLLGVDPRTGAEGFDVGGTYRGRAEPAEPVAPDAPRDLLALPAPGGPLTAAVRAEALYALPSRFGGPGLDQPVRGDARTPKRYLMPEQVDVRDPQAGNIPGGRRDVLRTATFNDGTLTGFAADSGVAGLGRSAHRLGVRVIAEPGNCRRGHDTDDTTGAGRTVTGMPVMCA